MTAIPLGRQYFLSTSTECLEGCPFCETHGCKNASSRSDANIFNILSRAKTSGYDSIAFSGNLLLSSQKDVWLEESSRLGLKNSVDIAFSAYQMLGKEERLWLERTQIYINFIFSADLS